MEPILFETIPLETVWGGRKLREYFHFQDYSEFVGQTWCFADQKGKSNRIINGKYKNLTLHDLWTNESRLFKSKYTEFPFIIALLAPEDDLSIQVHPQDCYAKLKGYDSGKNEAWYFIEPPENHHIVFGHTMKSYEELEKAIETNQIEKVLNYFSIQKRDYVYVPAGQIHACTKGSIVYEISQSTNITYRVYDYNRVDQNGNPRELHIDDAKACIQIPAVIDTVKQPKQVIETESFILRNYNHQKDFTLKNVEIYNEYECEEEKYQLVTVLYGHGTVNSYPIKIGDNFLIPASSRTLYQGNLEIMIAMEV